VIVLDTHAWVWWVTEFEQLPAEASTAIEEAVAQGAVHVSSISAWEVALLVARDRLVLTMAIDDWVARSEALPFIQFVPVDNRIALRSIELELPHRDPADRIIAATAIVLGAPLVTGDQKLRAFSGVATIWD